MSEQETKQIEELSKSKEAELQQDQATKLDTPKPKRTRVIAVVAAVVAIAVVAGIAACTLAPAQQGASDSSSASQSSKQASSQSTQASSKSASSSSASADTKSGEAQSDNAAKTGSDTNQSLSQSQGSSIGAQSNGGASSSSKEKVWVVDVPASTTVIHHDAVMTQEPGGTWTMCTVCGADVTGDPAGHAEQHVLEGITNASWTTMQKEPIDVVLEPAWDEVVETPEQGHWEYR